MFKAFKKRGNSSEAVEGVRRPSTTADAAEGKHASVKADAAEGRRTVAPPPKGEVGMPGRQDSREQEIVELRTEHGARARARVGDAT